MQRLLKDICHQAQQKEFLGLPPKSTSKRSSTTSAVSKYSDHIEHHIRSKRPSIVPKRSGSTGQPGDKLHQTSSGTAWHEYSGISYPRYRRRPMLCGSNPGATLRAAFPDGRPEPSSTTSCPTSPLFYSSFSQSKQPSSTSPLFHSSFSQRKQPSSTNSSPKSNKMKNAVHDLPTPERDSQEGRIASGYVPKWRQPVEDARSPTEASHLGVSRDFSESPDFGSRLPFLSHRDFDSPRGALALRLSSLRKDEKPVQCEVAETPGEEEDLGDPACLYFQKVSDSELEVLVKSLPQTPHPVTQVNVRDRTLTIHHISSQLETESSGYGVGGMIWEPAIVLSRYLASQAQPYGKYLAGKRVIELGSGTGTAGLAAATLGASVTLTDLPKILPLAALNMEANVEGIEDVSLIPLDWTQASRWPEGTIPKFDIILASDCIYASFMIPDLAIVLAELCAGGATLLWFWIRRHESVHRELWRALASKGLVVASLPIDGLGGSRCMEAFVGCRRGGHLDPVLAKPALDNGSFFLAEDGSVRGVRTEDTPTSWGCESKYSNPA